MSSERIIRSPFASDTIVVQFESFARTLWKSLSKNYEKIAVVEHETGRSTTYGELLDRARLAARLLTNHGCQQNDVIAIFSPNSIEWIVFLLAILRIGAIPAMVTSLLTFDELEYLLGICETRYICTTARLASLCLRVTKPNPLQRVFVLNENCDGCVDIGGESSLPEDNEHLLPSFETLNQQLDDRALVFFSSGTTGLQKAVLWSHTSLQYLRVLCRYPKAPHLDKTPLCFASLAHLSGFIPGVLSLTHGFTVYMNDKFNIDSFLNAIDRYQVESILIVSPIGNMMLKSNKETLDSLHDITIGAAPVTAELESQLLNRFPSLKQIRQVYGMTESGMLCVTPLNQRSSKPGSAGVPLPTVEIKVVDLETGEALGPGMDGEICAKSPMTMLGYANNQKATDDILRQEWIHTGDIGHYDEDGYIYVIDRLKDLIKYNAFQVSPSELESVLQSHAAVAEAAVIGIQVEQRGELPFACVVQKPNYTVTEGELQQYVNDRVAPYKRLRGGIKFVSVIPRTPSGKILRRIIKTALEKGNL